MFKIVRSYLYRPLAQGFIILKIARGQTKREKQTGGIIQYARANKLENLARTKVLAMFVLSPVIPFYLITFLYIFINFIPPPLPPPSSHVIRSHVRERNNENNDNTLKLRGGRGGGGGGGGGGA